MKLTEAMELSQEMVDCPLQVRDEVLPKVENFKHLEVLFTSEGRMEQEINWWIGVVDAVLWMPNRSVVVKRELSRQAKLSIYRLIFAPTPIFDYDLWVVTERTSSRTQVDKTSFQRRAADILERFRIELLLLHIERSKLRRLSCGRCSGFTPL